MDCSESEEESPSPFQSSQPGPSTASSNTIDVYSTNACLVCGSAGGSLHYGALSCVGCKGFFRRALKKADQLECFGGKGECVLSTGDRAMCRSCRLKKCLAVGMRPSAVQPDRPASLASKRRAKGMKKKSGKEEAEVVDEEWTRRLSVEMRTMLMTLLNLEAKISKGDSILDATKLYPLHVKTLRDLINHPEQLTGKRSRIRYEPYRQAANSELFSIAYRRLIAAIDWVEFLAQLVDEGLSDDDKIALIRASYAPLMIFAFAARTAQATLDENVLCLCNLAYVPRNIAQAYDDTYHLSDGIVNRTLDELVSPFRSYRLLEEEIVCISAIIVLNPLARDLSCAGAERVSSLRNRVCDALYAVVKEARSTQVTSVFFSKLLLTLVPVTHLANSMHENLVFAQTFSSLGGVTLLTNLFGCFPVEPFTNEVLSFERHMAEKGVQTNLSMGRRADGVLDEENDGQFRLLQPPGHYTLTEMFDDLHEGDIFLSDYNRPSTSNYDDNPRLY